MNVYKVTLLEVLVDGICDQGTYTEYSLEGVGARTQMGDGTQIFQGVALFLQRIVRSGRAFYRNLSGLNFEWLLCVRGSNQGTLCLLYTSDAADE